MCKKVSTMHPSPLCMLARFCVLNARIWYLLLLLRLPMSRYLCSFSSHHLGAQQECGYFLSSQNTAQDFHLQNEPHGGSILDSKFVYHQFSLLEDSKNLPFHGTWQGFLRQRSHQSIIFEIAWKQTIWHTITEAIPTDSLNFDNLR